MPAQWYSGVYAMLAVDVLANRAWYLVPGTSWRTFCMPPMIVKNISPSHKDCGLDCN